MGDHEVPTCRRCLKPLAGAHITHLVSATEQRLEVGYDGTGLAAVLAATSACSWNCLAILAATLAGGDADAAVLMVAERERQITGERFEPGHDEQEHPPGELARAGLAYAWDHAAEEGGREWELRRGPGGKVIEEPPDCWPLDLDWWKPKDRLRDLVRAGALIAADADRDVRARRLERERF